MASAQTRGQFGLNAGYCLGWYIENQNTNSGFSLGLDYYFPGLEDHTNGIFAGVAFPGGSGTPVNMSLGMMWTGRNWQESITPVFGVGLDLRTNWADTYDYNSADVNASLHEITNGRDGLGGGLILRAGIAWPKHISLFANFSAGRYATYQDVYKLDIKNDGWDYSGFETQKTARTYVTASINFGFRF